MTNTVPPTFPLTDLNQHMGAIRNIIARRTEFSINAPKSSSQWRSAVAFCSVLDGNPDQRSVWRSITDAWRLGDFVAVLGLARESNYRRDDQEGDDFVVFTFRPTS
jgi:hypothetical protein